MAGLCVWRTMILGILTSIYWIHETRASCPTGRFGDSCRYYCNCYPCDETTGVCGEGCSSGWIKGGGICQKKNVALRQPASTTSGTYGYYYYKWLPSKAVDGNTDINGGYRTCFHADASPSDWTVDLGQRYQLYDIRVYIRNYFAGRLADSFIYLDKSQRRSCYTFPSNIRDNPTDVVCNDTARYVTIRNPGNGPRHSDAINICEVEIYACSSGTYGSNCDRFCHCSYCDRWTGVCDGDCYPGWEGEGCDTECADQTYGVNCNQTCADRNCLNNNASCDRYAGSCVTGCLPGYKGGDCRDECEFPQYGANCSSLCQDRHCSGASSCDHVTGSCDQGCEAGWKGHDCRQVCDNNINYGLNCNRTCSDRKCMSNSASCDRFAGSCDTGCLPGWQRLDCSMECDETVYGQNCSSVCAERHCTGKSSCDHVTGSCDQGCMPGWKGSDCKEVCDKDHYGPNCTEMCSIRHCEGNSTCNHTTGQCDQGCEAGWDGIDCTHCDSAYYGTNCSYKCEDRHCEGSSSCDHVTGSCDQGCMDMWRGDACTLAVTDLSRRGGVSTPLMAGSVVGVAVILVLVLVLVFVIIRRNQAKTDKSPSHDSDNTYLKHQNEPGNVYANIGFDEDNQKRKNPHPAIGLIQLNGTAKRDSDSRSVDTMEEEEEYGNKSQLAEGPGEPERNYYNLNDVSRSHVITLSQLEVRVKEMEERKELPEEEFKNLPDGFFHPYDESQKPDNKGKNRFKGYYPYNYNRVIIHNDTDNNGGDYINASFLDGYNHQKQYIAAQGPFKGDIVVDFWRMICQEKCEVVVMVTGLVEGAKMKCLRYWPEKGTSTYGNVTVTMETQTILADYTITKLSVIGRQESSKRQVTHFNFTSWPDHGVPDTSSLLSFMWRVQKTCGQHKHPVVVHCSAGIGRTGTYIAVESLLSQAKTEGTVDVVSFVSNMRSQRKNMIQTKEQYLFIYQALMTAVVDGDTSLDADVISNHIDLDNLNDVTIGNKTVQQHLQTMSEQPENKVTPAIARVNSYNTKSGFFVMTSHPDKERIWNQIFNSGSRSLITWADDVEDESYLPSADRSVTTSRLTITLTETSTVCDFVTRNGIDIRRKNDKAGTVISHYHVTGTLQHPGVSVLIDDLLQWTRQPECEHSTIVSHSISETRLLILLVNITSRLQDDGKVDVISNMRRLQSLLGGPGFTLDDMRRCIEQAQRYLESLGIYANI